jgi:hypothetical protein
MPKEYDKHLLAQRQAEMNATENSGNMQNASVKSNEVAQRHKMLMGISLTPDRVRNDTDQ